MSVLGTRWRMKRMNPLKDELSWVLEHPYVKALLNNLTSTQERCTELLLENRELRREREAREERVRGTRTGFQSKLEQLERGAGVVSTPQVFSKEAGSCRTWPFCFGVSRVYGAPSGRNRATAMGGKHHTCKTRASCSRKQ